MILDELRYALRNLRKTPVFTAVAVGSLALGIGANTAIFSLLDQVLLRMLPVKNPQELVKLYFSHGPFRGSQRCNADCVSYPLIGIYGIAIRSSAACWRDGRWR